MNEVKRINPVLAALKIENYYTCFRNRQLFKLLKTSICAAEQSLTKDLIKTVAPLEYDFFKNDDFINMKIKFRFGGSEFPPKVYYKIYMGSKSCLPKPITTGNVLTNSNVACYGALKNMGIHKYFDIFLNDMEGFNGNHIKTEKEIINIKDYMQYSSSIDDLPAKIGGRNNPWKKLDHTVLSKKCPMYDIFSYINTKKMSSTVRYLLCRGFQSEKLEYFITMISSQNKQPSSKIKKKINPGTFRNKLDTIERAKRMLKLYSEKLPVEKSDQVCQNKIELFDRENGINTSRNFISILNLEDWEDDAQTLYEWTTDL